MSIVSFFPENGEGASFNDSYISPERRSVGLNRALVLSHVFAYSPRPSVGGGLE